MIVLLAEDDRSVRESGFDPSDRYGPFSVDIVHYAPVCLNALLYRMEEDAAVIRRRLGDPAGDKHFEELSLLSPMKLKRHQPIGKDWSDDLAYVNRENS